MVSVSGIPAPLPPTTSSASRGLGPAPAPPTEAALASALATQVELSTTAVLLGELQTGIPMKDLSTTPETTSPSPPLLPAAPTPDTPATHELATTLEDHLVHSGLFYEAHVAEWAAGQRPIESLAREPQAAYSQASTPPEGKTTTAPTIPHGTASAAPGLSGDAWARIQTQLHVLDQGRVSWQGQVWPGQTAHMVFYQEDSSPGGQGASSSDAQPAIWQSELQLHLADLGAIHARVLLEDDTVHMRIEAPHDRVALLRQALPGLHQQLTLAGISTLALTVTAPSLSHD